MRTILTVDDNEQIREILAPMLKMWVEDQNFDLTIVEKNNGAEALEWVKEHGKPNMLLLDVRMPIMGGAEFLRQTALLGFDFRPFTLLLTGYADDLEEHLGSDALIMKHLRKPFTAPELFTVLDTLLESIDQTTLNAEPDLYSKPPGQ